MIRLPRKVAAAVAGALAGCAPVHTTSLTSTATSAIRAADVVGTWSLDRLDETPIQPRQAAVQFSANGVYSASVGCRDIVGSYTLDRNTVTVGPVRMTDKGCLIPIEHEQLITSALSGGGPWTVRVDGHDNLKLYGRHQLSLSRMPN